MAVLAHLVAGQGPRDTMMLHGFLGSGRNLWGLARRWAAADPSRRLVLPDLTGHGASPPLPPGADLSTLAADVLETARSLGLREPLSLVGHSLGGRVALAAVLLAGDRVSDVTLLDISPGPIPPGAAESGRVLDAVRRMPERADSRDEVRALLLGEGLSGAMADWLLMNLVSSGVGYRWRIDREALSRAAPRVNAADLWPALSVPGVSVRCVRGALSAYVPGPDASRMESLDCPVTTVAGAGHFLHVDAPDAVLAALAG
ncbi:alpha/beta hydrolase [Myxococcota bacterium]|nr:alpha/beta hydrolase [Myxococcota bacterium]